jgi:hypothetical protein
MENSFSVWKIIIVILCVKFQMPNFPMVLEQTCNPTNVPNRHFKGIVISYLLLSVSLYSFWVFRWPENALSEHRSISLTKQYRKQFRCLDVCYRDVMCAIWNASLIHGDEHKGAIVRTCLIHILKESSLLYFFCRVFHYVHF